MTLVISFIRAEGGNQEDKGEEELYEEAGIEVQPSVLSTCKTGIELDGCNDLRVEVGISFNLTMLANELLH